MNRIYRLVWNDLLGAWVPASELAKAKSKRAGSSRRAASTSPRSAITGAGMAVAGMFFGFTATGAQSETVDKSEQDPRHTQHLQQDVIEETDTSLAEMWWPGSGMLAASQSPVQFHSLAATTEGGLDTTNMRYIRTNGLLNGTDDAWNPGSFGIGIGTKANAGGATQAWEGVSIGPDSRTDGRADVALGSGARTFIGAGADLKTAGGSIAIGFDAQASSAATTSNVVAGAVAIGTSTQSSGEYSVALGTYAKASGKQSVALGNTSNDDGRAFTVSIGNSAGIFRTLSNMGAGTLDHDGVNVSQLKPLIAGLGGSAAMDGNGKVTQPTYNVQGGTFSNVGSALTALNTGVNTNAGNFSILNTGIANGTVGLVQQDPDTKLITIGKDVVGTVLNVAGKNAGNTVNRKITGVANGDLSATSLDAVNGSQLKATNDRIDDFNTNVGDIANMVKYDNNAHTAVTLGASSGQQVKLGNLANGTQINDAVNFSQLKPMVDALGGGAKIDAATGVVTGPAYRVQNGNQNTVGSALDALDTGVKKNTGDITHLGDTINNITNGTAGLVQQDPNSKQINIAKEKDGTTMSIAGISGNRKLTGVTAGTLSKNSTDAVNGSQLNATNENVTAVGGRVTTAEGHINTINNTLGDVVKYDDADHKSVTLGNAGTPVTLGNIANGTKANDAVNLSQLKPAVDALGGGAKIDAATGTVTGPTYKVQGGTQTNVGSALDALDTGVKKNTGDITNLGDTVNDITNNITNGTMGLVQQDPANKTITIGKDVGGTLINVAGTDGTRAINRKITGVADGTLSKTSTDAVNGSQLFATNEKIDTINTNIGDISNMVKYDDAGRQSVTFGAPGTPVTLGNVANGTKANDAVNLSQLKPAVDALGGGAKIDAATGVVTGPTYKVQGGTQTNVGSALDALDTGVKKNTGDITHLGDTVNNITNGTAGLVQQDVNSKQITVAKDNAGTSVSFAGTDGNRKLTDVSAGALSKSSTDAVNGSQLFATNENVTAVGGRVTTAEGHINTINNTLGDVVKYDDADHKSVTLGNAGVPVTLGNIANGIKANDAVNLSQLKPAVDALGGGAKIDAATGVVTGPAYKVQGGKQATVGAALDALDTGVKKNTGDITNLGDTVNDITNNITNGTVGLVQQDPASKIITVGKDVAGTVINVAGTDGIRAVNRKITGVAAGTLNKTSTDAVNGSQLFATNEKIDTINTNIGSIGNMVKYDDDDHQSVTFGATGTPVTLGNVANGTKTNDAVNLSQLKPAVDALGGGAKIDAATGVVTGPTYKVQGGTQTNVGSALDALDTGIKKNTGDITNLGDTVNNITNGTAGLVQQDVNSKQITVAKDNAGASVSFAGTAGNRKLTDVSAGALSKSSTDAVNGSQLFATNENVTAVDGRVTTAEGHINTINNTLGDVVKYDDADHKSVTLGNAGTPVTLGNIANGTKTNDAVNVSQLKPAVEALGGGARIDAVTGSVTGPIYTVQSGTQTTVGGALDALDTGVKKNAGDITTITNNITNGTVGLVQQDATSKNITIGKDVGGTVINVAGTDGTQAIDRKLTGVAEGDLTATSTDAVNGKQLKATNDNVNTNTTHIAQNTADISNINGTLTDVVKYDGADHKSVTLGNAGTPVTLGNIANGTKANDAVNLSQLTPAVEALGGGARID
ncbi:ESPR-type extended signal peptide-containing protein, partial [Dyella tabacisoli]